MVNHLEPNLYTCSFLESSGMDFPANLFIDFQRENREWIMHSSTPKRAPHPTNMHNRGGLRPRNMAIDQFGQGF